MPALRDALQDLTEDVFFDLLESEEAYLLVLDVPGITAESLDCSIENGRISIDAQREKTVPADYQYLEENRSLFLDVDLPLPDDALETETDLDASVERGILELTLPKTTAEETTIDIVDERDSAGENGGSDATTGESETDESDPGNSNSGSSDESR